MKTIKGKIDGFGPVKSGVDKQGKPWRKWSVKIGGLYLSGFGDVPGDLLDMFNKDNNTVFEISYTENGAFKNYKSAKKIKNPPSEVVNRGDSEKMLSAEKHALEALNVFKRVYGRCPESQGEFAVVNTVFIFLSK